MSVLAQTRYREDYLEAFERTKATLPPTVRNDTQDQGGSMVFLVSGSGGRTAVTRGPRGLIPPADNVQTQVTLNFKEAHDKVILTNFDIFRSQGDQLRMMREQSLGVIHRQQDAEIIAALDTATITLGAVTVDMTLAAKISTMLYNANVGTNGPGMITALVTPAVFNTMIANIDQFSNADYTAQRVVDNGPPMMSDQRYWMGIQWIVHNGLPNVGTSAATNYVYHHDAVGYAISSRGISADLSYNSEEDYTWRRASIFHAAVKLQNAGIIKFTSDDTPLSS